MTRHQTRTCGLLLGVAGAVALVWGRLSYGDDKPAPPPCKKPLEPKVLEPLVQDATACGNCHTNGPPPSKVLKALCRCTEQTFWEHNDKHQDAFDALADQRSQDICKNLKAGPPKENADCMGCHSIAFINVKKPVSEINKEYLEQGVSCLACHGAWDNWKFPHGETEEAKRVCWRKLSRKDKETDWGMTDLWDPVRRTEVCASCHVGDPRPEVHRFVTHAMYAAGHPPLPAFETAAFCNGLPRHWQLMSEKTPEMQKQDYGWNPNELEQTKLAVVGQAVAFREAVNLLATRAGQTPADQGLDFALFDCSACHHDLKQPSWRQTAGNEGPPGRPGLRRWSPAGLDLCIWYAGGTDDGRKQLRADFETRMGALRSAFTSRPYGDAAKVKEAGDAVVEWANSKLIGELTREVGAGSRYDAKAALNLLKRLAQDAAHPAPGKTPDYDGARQTAWTFRSIYDEACCALNRSQPDSEAARALQENGKAIQVQLDCLDGLLNLNLPNAKGIPPDVDTDKAKEMREGELKAFLPEVLERTANYDPKKVQDAFAELAKLLP